ncbi:MAG: hypothetical protein ABI162_17570 [Luteolibacter sp.]
MRKKILITVLLLGLIFWRVIVSQSAIHEIPGSGIHQQKGIENQLTVDSQPENPQEERQTPAGTNKGKFRIVRDGRIAAPPAGETRVATPLLTISSTVTTDAGVQENVPDGIGIFPEIKMKKGAKAQVRLSMEPNSHAILQVLDGGQMNDSVDVLEIRADANGSVEFEYSPLLNEGTYRIAIDNGGPKKFMYFTVG